MGKTDFSDQFRKEIIRHKCIGYNSNVMRQSACLVINPITVDKTPFTPGHVPTTLALRPKKVRICRTW